MMNAERALITGVAGMLGSHLLERMLPLDYQLVGIDNLSSGRMQNIEKYLDQPNFNFTRVDVCDSHLLKKLGNDFDIIIHFAAHKKIGDEQNSIHLVKTNGMGTLNIFELARKCGAKVLFASSSDVYGNTSISPINENAKLELSNSNNKRTHYAISKLYGEQIAFLYYYDYNIPIIVLRYFGSFSERSNFFWMGGHIPVFIRAILNNQEVIIHGDGLQTRSMGYGDDSAEATLLAIQSDKAIGEIINIGNDEELNILDTARLIHSIVNPDHELKIKFINQDKIFSNYREISRKVPDLTKAKSLLGYEPKIKLIDEIKLTIERIISREETLNDLDKFTTEGSFTYNPK